MKEEDEINEIMAFLEKDSEPKTPELKREAVQIRDLLEELNTLSYPATSEKQKNRFYKFLEKTEIQNRKPLWNKRKYIAAIAMAASLLLAVFLWFGKDEKLKETYASLENNADRLAFIYSLNSRELKPSEVHWLEGLLQGERQPNIKITLIDLLDQNRHKLSRQFAAELRQSRIPTVQMALLHVLEQIEEPFSREAIRDFSSRQDLDVSVAERASEVYQKLK
ncbi:hypothetical protein [Robiginitalea sp. IMCC43444]|uniref:hypothetical protein n=1 Tax=Robiginitalea sp. IMCC43444 TaxID=3459121 RepID=UPI004042E650